VARLIPVLANELFGVLKFEACPRARTHGLQSHSDPCCFLYNRRL